MKKVQNILWISFILSIMLHGIGIFRNNIDLRALSAGMIAVTIVLQIPYLFASGKDRGFISQFFFLILMICAISFCVGILTDRVMLHITTGAFALATLANVLLAHYQKEPEKSKAS